ncbi:PIN domain-containing protein [Rhodobacter sphaeroides]|jgi:predicted nucleic acid-binding protein|uniref:Ribonuclease VapC n=1 Tax=Cereibacter sphaeroides (strain ATCC 17023 / DSM 158 / JCM 6121 / CCUG 31486 / LMG 2827 / NBRC 12203 / NCIMB 8253 / ATH 2.4.1.) TaxID=272943 RepID=Q3IUZ4_CERS4|nr:PIN domain-containing protein [Cereibacter sphaeroides]ABA81640.1 putative nucleic-acid-binding protein, contains PIN domain [Cereibacter sphaeroides 2.4.1]AMJ49786.1 pilus assembly protein [Cereibacter sphaeroides]ANS36545.1 pilus assembly protein [Cereibacter sphaeroides]ATN65557.1 pilus assembly protein [Cereibacter sphaeroides]AXC64165.1 PIN domain-containing protein [Cereibacter sphaeroides 2.4.1]
MSAEFADTNVILYLLDNGPKADCAEEILGHRPRISVQVLNETLVNCRRKAGLSWEEAGAFLEGVRALCPVESLTIQTHDVGRALAERYGFSIYDSIIVASALVAGCTTLWSEDMQDGLLVEGQLRIVNPFA